MRIFVMLAAVVALGLGCVSCQTQQKENKQQKKCGKCTPRSLVVELI